MQQTTSAPDRYPFEPTNVDFTRGSGNIKPTRFNRYCVYLVQTVTTSHSAANKGCFCCATIIIKTLLPVACYSYIYLIISITHFSISEFPGGGPPNLAGSGGDGARID